MEGKLPPVMIKQEPPEDKNAEDGLEEMSESPPNAQSANTSEVCDLKKPKSGKKLNSAERPFDVKRIKKEQPFSMKEGKTKKPTGAEVEVSCVEPPRAGVFPYRTKSDFCCTICNAHMNSIQMWESHIRGKRHLKNSKKGTVTAAATAAASVPVKKEKVDDVAGLYYIDTKGAQSPPQNTAIYERQPESPADSKPKVCNSPEPSPPPATTTPVNVDIRNFNEQNLTMTERINYILQLSTSIYPQNESDFNEIQSILTALSQSILQYEIRQLPLAAQQKLAKELFRGN